MKDHNTMSEKSFIIQHITYALLAVPGYLSCLFRCFGSLSRAKSIALFLGIVVFFVFSGLFIDMDEDRNGWHVFSNLITGFGLYTLLTYTVIKPTLVVAVMSVSLFLSAVFACLVMFRRIGDRSRRKWILHVRYERSMEGFFVFTILGMSVILIILLTEPLFDSARIRIYEKKEAADPYTVENRIDTLLLLREERWDELDAKQKLEVLQTIADIERHYLGLSDRIEVRAKVLDGSESAYYADADRTIVVDMNNLLYASSDVLVCSVCHEAYHCYEHRLADLYGNASDADRKLYAFKKAAVYFREFENYIDADENMEDYFNQECEIDARIHGDESRDFYFNCIERYLFETEG